MLTSHAAQGKTVDWVFVAQSAQLSAAASDARQFLVSITRGREGVKLYTEDRELLRELVTRERQRPMASELFREQASSQRLGTMQVSQEAAKTMPPPLIVPVPKKERECELVMEL